MPNVNDTNIDQDSNLQETFSDALDDLISVNKDTRNQRIISPLQELSASDLEYSMIVRQKYGLVEDELEKNEELAPNGEEWETLIKTLEKIRRRFLDDLIVGKG